MWHVWKCIGAQLIERNEKNWATKWARKNVLFIFYCRPTSPLLSRTLWLPLFRLLADVPAILRKCPTRVCRGLCSWCQKMIVSYFFAILLLVQRLSNVNAYFFFIFVAVVVAESVVVIRKLLQMQVILVDIFLISML